MKPARQAHPFTGAVKKKVTQRHRPLIWECMLGTVYAVSPAGTVGYFDYNWDAARQWAEVDDCTDLRLDKSKFGVSFGGRYSSDELPPNRTALWGVRKVVAP